jgi:putative transposase
VTSPPRRRAPQQGRQLAIGLRDELLAVEAFSSLLEAQVLVEDWRIEYNTVQPHSTLGYLTPTDYAKTWTSHQPQLS